MTGDEIVNKIFDLQDMHYQEHSRPVEVIGLPSDDYDTLAEFLKDQKYAKPKYFEYEPMIFNSIKIERNNERPYIENSNKAGL